MPVFESKIQQILERLFMQTSKLNVYVHVVHVCDVLSREQQ